MFICKESKKWDSKRWLLIVSGVNEVVALVVYVEDILEHAQGQGGKGERLAQGAKPQGSRDGREQ